MTAKEQLLEAIDDLTPEQHHQLLVIAHQMQQRTPRGTVGINMLALLDDLSFTSQDVNEMMTAIQANEDIDWDGWR